MATLCRWCAGTLNPFELFDMAFICHTEEVEYLRKFRALLREVDNVSSLAVMYLCCFSKPYDRFYHVAHEPLVVPVGFRTASM